MSLTQDPQYRYDIQGLRALAVFMVIIFHAFPSLLPGGYIGVDVFFVISGYLITGQLVREIKLHNSISLSNFYARRIRRLFPMASLIILVLFALFPLLPKAYWPETIWHVLASTFYFENIWLAIQSTDYLDSQNVASPLQHFWSLAVEEQFYIFWPLILIFLYKPLTSHQGKIVTNALAVCVLGALTLLSLIFSIFLTRYDKALAYFITPTRFWELGLGGLLAMTNIYLKANLPRLTLTALGLVFIVLGAIFLSPQSNFPGYLALIPTLGAVFIIFSRGTDPLNQTLLQNKFMRYVGDISYSLYLWHWPIIILAKYQGWGNNNILSFLLLGFTCLLASLSKHFIEDYFLKSPYWKSSNLRVFIFAFLTMVIICCGSTFLMTNRTNNVTFAPDSNHPGAASLLTSTPTPQSAAIPPYNYVKYDLPDLYTLGCHAPHSTGSILTPCHAGNKHSPIKIFLIGDSHAAQWWPALSEIANKNGWYISAYTKSSCPPITIDIMSNGKIYHKCMEWALALHDEIRRHPPSLIIYAQSAEQTLPSSTDKSLQHDIIATTLVTMWNNWLSAGLKIIAVKDTPLLREDFSACLGSESCEQQTPYSTPDPIVTAAQQVTAVRLVDLNEAICPQKKCYPVIGNIVVWRDTHHLTATYVKSLSLPFEQEIKKILSQQTTTAQTPKPQNPSKP